MADLSNSTKAPEPTQPAVPSAKSKQKPKPAKERRSTRRIPIEVEVSLVSETNFFNGFSEDLSDGGLFISTYQSLAVGARVELSINLPEADPIAAQGRVVWVREPLDGVPPGVGVMFEKLADDDRRKILDFIAVRAPIFYDL